MSLKEPANVQDHIVICSNFNATYPCKTEEELWLKDEFDTHFQNSQNMVYQIHNFDEKQVQVDTEHWAPIGLQQRPFGNFLITNADHTFIGAPLADIDQESVIMFDCISKKEQLNSLKSLIRTSKNLHINCSFMQLGKGWMFQLITVKHRPKQKLIQLDLQEAIDFNNMPNFEMEENSSALELFLRQMIHLEQYAESVLSYSSQYNNPMSISYAPENLTGKPAKYPNYGDFPETYILRSYGKWWNESEAAQPLYMPQDVDPIISEDYITLRFERAVVPASIMLYETYNPGAVVRLWGRLSGGLWQLLWEGPPQVCTQASRVFCPKIRKIRDLINEIRIDFNQSSLSYHTSLDSVLMAGYKPKSALQYNLLKWGLLEPPVVQQKMKRKPPRDINCNNIDLFAKLPYEVIVHIFKYLDLKSLCRCAQVNKQWFEASLDSGLYRELSLKRYWHKVDNTTIQRFINRCKGLRKLDLSWCSGQITQDIFIEFLQKCCRHLTHLSLGSCDFVKNHALPEIAKSSELVDLRLRNCQCHSWHYVTLASLTRLVALDLYNSSIIDESLIAILKANPCLKHLIIDFCGHLELLDEVAETVAQYNKQLVTWSSWKTHSLTCIGVGQLGKCPHLRELDVGWCLIISDPRDCLEHIATGCSELRRLIISGWRGVNDHLLLPIIRSCKHMVQLDLLGIKNITGDICEVILACLPKLRLLEISFCDSIKQEQVMAWEEQYPNVVIQRSCKYVVTDYWYN